MPGHNFERCTRLVVVATEAGVEHFGSLLSERALYLDWAEARAQGVHAYLCKQELGHIFLHQCSRCELLRAPCVFLDERETRCAEGPPPWRDKQKEGRYSQWSYCRLNRVENMVRKIYCDEIYGGSRSFELI